MHQLRQSNVTVRTERNIVEQTQSWHWSSILTDDRDRPPSTASVRTLL